MKRPSLLPGMLAATLFLGGGLWAEEAKPVTTEGEPVAAVAAIPAQSEAEKLDENAKQRRAAAVTAEVMRRRALQALRADLIALFDKNGNGKFDGDEFAAVTVFLAGTDMVVPNPTPAAEQARLMIVAAEVERRRALRESAVNVPENTRPAPAPEHLEEAIQAVRADVTRLEKLAAEIALRRVEREKAQPAGERK